MIVQFIEKCGQASRKSIDHLILPKLSPTLTDTQKSNKVRNYLTALRKLGKIKSTGYGLWEIYNEP